MLDGAKTTTTGARWIGGMVLACSLAASAAMAARAPASQELAGTARSDEITLVPQPALSGDLAPPPRDGVSEGGGMVTAILFAPGSARLTPRATRVLDQLGRTLTAPDLAGDRFRVEGHPDMAGAFERGHDLARRRAQAVAEYLEQNCGVAAARLDLGVSTQLWPARRVRLIDLGR